MARPSLGKYVLHKHFVLPGKEDCYIYKRPNSNVWQYYLLVTGEGEERKSTKVKGKSDDEEFGKSEALNFALERKLEVMSRQKQGLKARRIKKLFDFIDDFLESESKRISPYPRPGFITQETFRIKTHHLKLLRRFYKDRSIKVEDLDYQKLYDYPIWRMQPDPVWNPTVPKTNHTVIAELTTIRAYFDFLFRKGFIPSLPTFHKIKSESLRNIRRDYLNPQQYQQTLNRVRSWSNSKGITETQSYNRKIIYQAILIMSNSCMRIGELRKLRWFDLENNPNLSSEQQGLGHLIRIRAETTKVGQPRTIQSPTTKRFEEIRKLTGIPKDNKTKFPSIPSEFRNGYVISKFNHPDKPLGQGTWDRLWKEIKDLCEDEYWGGKNITWYSFRHTGISFAVSRGVPLLPLSINCGTGIRYISDVYYHHESESKQTWDTLNQNRRFYDYVSQKKDELLIDMEDALETINDGGG